MTKCAGGSSYTRQRVALNQHWMIRLRLLAGLGCGAMFGSTAALGCVANNCQGSSNLETFSDAGTNHSGSGEAWAPDYATFKAYAQLDALDFDGQVLANAAVDNILQLPASAGPSLSPSTCLAQVHTLSRTVDFMDTATLTHIAVYDSTGALIADPGITSDSGFDYESLTAPLDTSAVREPALGWMTALLCGAGLAIRKISRSA